MVAVAGVVRANLPDGFVEAPYYKAMTTWVVPLDRSPKTHNGGPLPVAALGERKQYVSLYLMGLYFDPAMNDWLDRAWKESGCRLDRGAVCIRFRDLDDIPFDVLAEAVSYLSVDGLIAAYEHAAAR